MIIKAPLSRDISKLNHLWQQAFGDSEEFVEGFFQTGFSENRCLLAEKDGQLLAALYWFDCLWEGKKIAYLYAIATDENYRGKGVCRALMQHTHLQLQQQGYSGALLVPADEGLAGMYGKMGYTCILPEAQKSLEEPPQLQRDQLTQISPEEYVQRRKQLLPAGGIWHSKAAMDYLATFAKFYAFDGGICCGDPALPMEWLPGYGGDPAMYLPLDGAKEMPTYFALALA